MVRGDSTGLERRAAAREPEECATHCPSERSAPRRRRPRLGRTNIDTGQRHERHGLQTVVTTAFGSCCARPACFSRRGKSADRPRSTRRAARTRGGCDVGQRAARSSPRSQPRLDRTNTAIGRRGRIRKFLVSAFEPRGARPARVSNHGDAADEPRSTRCAVRTWRGCGAGQRAARSSLRRRPRRDRNNNATSRRKRIKKSLASAFE